MTNIKNEPKLNVGIINLSRAHIEHRAVWMGLIFNETEKVGVDAEDITRKAISRCGSIHGDGYKASCKVPGDFQEFKATFLNGIAIKTFEMDNIQVNSDELSVEFHYCPLVNAWKKLGFSDEKCAKLCDITMDGDRAIAEVMALKLDLSDTIAKGNNTCKLRFYKGD